MERKRICFLTWNVFDLGGVQRVITVLANELCKDYDVEIICAKDNKQEDRELYNLSSNINVVIKNDLMKYSFASRVKNNFAKKINNKKGIFNKNSEILKEIYYPTPIRKKVVKFLKQRNYDVIIASESFFSMILAIEKENITSKVIGWQHNSTYAYFNEPNKYFWQREELFKKYIHNLDKYIVLTEKDKRELKATFNINGIRVYNPLSFQSNTKCNLNNKNIISVGRLSVRQKGFDLLLEAFNKVHLECNEWKLSIVGDGPDKDIIEEIISKLGLEESVFLKGSTNDIKKEYLESAIFVSASRWEGFGLVITEAMECGNAVVSFNNSGPAEIITNGKNGILVENGKVEELADKIILLIRDEELRKNISDEAIKRSEDFNINNIVKQWNDIIEKL